MTTTDHADDLLAQPARVAHAVLCDLFFDAATSLCQPSSLDVQRTIQQLSRALLVHDGFASHGGSPPPPSPHTSALLHAARVAHATLADLLLDHRSSLSWYSRLDLQNSFDVLQATLLCLEPSSNSESPRVKTTKPAAARPSPKPR